MTHLTQAEFARQRGVNKSTVTRWIQNGRLTPEPNGLIDPERAARQLDATESPLPHHQARKAQFDEARQVGGLGGAEKTQTAPSERGATVVQQGATDEQQTEIPKDVVAHRTKLAMMREREWTATQREIEARKSAGELCEVSRVREAWRSAYVLLRATLKSMPPRAAPELAACKGDVAAIEHDLDAQVDIALRECSEAFNRKLEGIA